MAADQGHSGVVGMYRSFMTAVRRKADGSFFVAFGRMRKQSHLENGNEGIIRTGWEVTWAQGRGFKLLEFLSIYPGGV